jgi:outer membrane immunogenic protein
MKKFFVVIVAILAATMSLRAASADSASKALAAIGGPAWTGFYVNGGLGYGAWTADTTTQNKNTGACALCVVQVQGGKGWLGLVGIGYDHQLTPNIVAGVFADYDFSHLTGTIQDQSNSFAGEIKQTSAWTIGARVGWLISPSVLAYLNGGYSSAHFSATQMVNTRFFTTTGFSTPAKTTHGGFLGGGLEAGVTANLFWRNEYRLATYADRTLPDTNGATGFDSITFKPTVQTFTTQLVYKFGNGAAGARDVGAKAPMTVADPIWTGPYVNGGLGYGAWTADTTTLNPATGGCRLCVAQVQGGKGWLGLVGIGYDYQLTSNIVAGVFADHNLSNLTGTIQDQRQSFVGKIKQTSAWAIGARVGWLISPSVLAYANGGYSTGYFSSARMVFTDIFTTTGFSTPAETTHGWILGGGLEAAVTPNLFWRNEYRLAAYAERTLPDTRPALAADSIIFKPTVQTFTTQLVYKFNWLH